MGSSLDDLVYGELALAMDLVVVIGAAALVLVAVLDALLAC